MRTGPHPAFAALVACLLANSRPQPCMGHQTPVWSSSDSRGWHRMPGVRRRAVPAGPPFGSPDLQCREHGHGCRASGARHWGRSQTFRPDPGHSNLPPPVQGRGGGRWRASGHPHNRRPQGVWEGVRAGDAHERQAQAVPHHRRRHTGQARGKQRMRALQRGDQGSHARLQPKGSGPPSADRASRPHASPRRQNPRRGGRRRNRRV